VGSIVEVATASGHNAVEVAMVAASGVVEREVEKTDNAVEAERSREFFVFSEGVWTGASGRRGSEWGSHVRPSRCPHWSITDFQRQAMFSFRGNWFLDMFGNPNRLYKCLHF
jgi:hypothetical protein